MPDSKLDILKELEILPTESHVEMNFDILYKSPKQGMADQFEEESVGKETFYFLNQSVNANTFVCVTLYVNDFTRDDSGNIVDADDFTTVGSKVLNCFPLSETAFDSELVLDDNVKVKRNYKIIRAQVQEDDNMTATDANFIIASPAMVERPDKAYGNYSEIDGENKVKAPRFTGSGKILKKGAKPDDFNGVNSEAMFIYKGFRAEKIAGTTENERKSLI